MLPASQPARVSVGGAAGSTRAPTLTSTDALCCSAALPIMPPPSPPPPLPPTDDQPSSALAKAVGVLLLPLMVNGILESASQ